MRYKSSKNYKIKHNECSSYGDKVLKAIIRFVDVKNIDTTYYNIMGDALNAIYESRDIEFECRDFIIHDLRKYFIKTNIIGNNINLELLKYGFTPNFGRGKNVYGALLQGEINRIEGLSYSNLDLYAKKMAYSVGYTKKSFEGKPKELNSIWFSNKKSSTEKIDIKSMIENKNFLSKEGDWNYILWTNNKKFIPQSIKKLKTYGIETRSIYTLKDQIIDKIEDGNKLFITLEKLIDAGHLGMASDLFRYMQLYIRGGVYMDDNIKIMHQISPYYETYDFFTGDSQNNFITTKAGHIILEKTMEAIANIFKNPPEYLDKVSTKTLPITYYTFVRSIIIHSNEDGNVDFYDDYYDAKGIEEPDPGEIKTDPSGVLRWSKNDQSMVTMEEWKSVLGITNIWLDEQEF